MPAGAGGWDGGRREQGKGPGGQAPSGSFFMEGPKGVAFVRPLAPFPRKTCWQGCGRPGWRAKETRQGTRGPSALRTLILWKGRRALPLSVRWAPFPAKPVGKGAGGRDGGRGREEAARLRGLFPTLVAPWHRGSVASGRGRPGWRAREGRRGPAAEPFPAPVAPRHGGSVAGGRGRPGWRAKGTRQGTRGPSALRVLFMEGLKCVAFAQPLAPFPAKPVGKGAGGRVGGWGKKGARLRGLFPVPVAQGMTAALPSGRGRLGWRAKGTRQGTRGPSALRVLFYGRVEGRCLCPAAGPSSRAGRAGGGLGRRAGRPSAPAFFYPRIAAKNAKLLPQITRLPWWKGENGRNIGDCVCISPVAMLH